MNGITAFGLSIAIACAASPANGQYKIEDFEFSWKVESREKTKLSVQKDRDTTLVVISDESHSIRLNVEEAIDVGRALAQAPDIAQRLKSNPGTDHEAPAGRYVVHFFTLPNGTFHIDLRHKDRVFAIIGSVDIDRESAKAFAPHLVRARELVAFVDKRIAPNDPAKEADIAKQDKAATEKMRASLAAARELAEAETAKAKAEAEQLDAETKLANAKRELAEAKESAAAAQIKAEDAAAKLLQLAKPFVTRDAGTASKRLKQIVDDFPSTAAADEAKRLLDKLK